MSPSHPLGPLLASVAMSMSIVSLHGVASTTNTESASWAAPAAPQSRRTTSKCHRRLPVSAVLLAWPNQWAKGVSTAWRAPPTSSPRAGHPPAAPQTC
ncbi:hypothetical protein PR003_g28756 [Phytophthora rubi]|nr:hypothetical protein PR003_g28756 [Phytophthora rubi]